MADAEAPIGPNRTDRMCGGLYYRVIGSLAQLAFGPYTLPVLCPFVVKLKQ